MKWKGMKNKVEREVHHEVEGGVKNEMEGKYNMK
jgi:hypothetical protein